MPLATPPQRGRSRIFHADSKLQKRNHSSVNLNKLRKSAHLLLYSAYLIDQLYTQIGKVFMSYWRIEPFVALFWALSIVLVHILKQLTQPAGLASLNNGTVTVLYGRGQLGSI